MGLGDGGDGDAKAWRPPVTRFVQFTSLSRCFFLCDFLFSTSLFVCFLFAFCLLLFFVFFLLFVGDHHGPRH